MQTDRGQLRLVKSSRRPRPSGNSIWLLAALAVAVALAVSVAIAAQGQAQNPPPSAPPRPHSILLPEANRPPDANDIMEMQEQKQKDAGKDVAAANLERKKQIVDDSGKLLKLAADLKTEIDKTNKDMLSLDVIRKADEIERLAKGVKEKMKLSMAGAS
jgi:hypothetical protein